jgi:hypothetical protein
MTAVLMVAVLGVLVIALVIDFMALTAWLRRRSR